MHPLHAQGEVALHAPEGLQAGDDASQGNKIPGKAKIPVENGQIAPGDEVGKGSWLWIAACRAVFDGEPLGQNCCLFRGIVVFASQVQGQHGTKLAGHGRVLKDNPGLLAGKEQADLQLSRSGSCTRHNKQTRQQRKDRSPQEQVCTDSPQFQKHGSPFHRMLYAVHKDRDVAPFDWSLPSECVLLSSSCLPAARR